MSTYNPAHPCSLGRQDLQKGLEILWCDRSGRVIKQAVICGPVFGTAKPWVPLQVSHPNQETRLFELYQMGIIPDPDTGAWAPSFTIPAKHEDTLAPQPTQPRRRP